MALLTFWLYRALGALIALLPLTVGIRAGRALGLLGYFLLGKYRRIALRNLAIAFRCKTAGERRTMARLHFATLVGNLFSMEKIAHLPREEMRALVTIEGLEIVQRFAAEKRGVVYILGHLGSWELLAQISPMVFTMPSGTVFQRLTNPHMDAHIRRTRAQIGLTLFERKEGFNAACEMLRKGGMVGVLIDQHAGDAGVWCPFFGRLASTTPLAATLALRTGAALLPIAMSTDGIGRWRMRIEEPVAGGVRDIGAATALVNAALEAQIRRQPEDWFWVHNRWKTPSPKFLLATYKRGIVETAGELQPFSILIRSSNWLGDAVMTVPAVRAIKHGRPDARVAILTPAKLAEVWALVPEVDEVIPFDPPSGTGLLRTLRGLVHPWRVARLLRGRGFEAAVLFPNSIRTAFEIWLAGIPRRVGYPGHAPRGWLLNQVFQEKKRKKNAPPEPKHQVFHYLKLAEFIGAERGAWTNNVVANSSLRIAVCPGAEYGGAKRWLPGRYAEVIRALSAEQPYEWQLVGTAKDRPAAEEIAALTGPAAHVDNLCGKTTLTELIALLRGCRLLLTNDTGTMHLAALLGVRTVSIFGSTEPELTGPLGEGHTVLRRKVDCSPCFLRECPIDFRCMKAIESAEVIEAVRRL